ncbi:MAG: DUF4363 family protein [Ruminococcaceae bacterium]|nr:DUF4363 family protein [Oscillospiraceae bacterium]
MKTFIVSLITLFIIISSITAYVFFLKFTLDDIMNYLEKISSASENEDWNKVSLSYNTLSDKWHNKIKLLEAFTSHNKTDAISQYILEIKNHIDNHDKKQLKVVIDKLRLNLKFLYDDELPTLENII